MAGGDGKMSVEIKPGAGSGRVIHPAREAAERSQHQWDRRIEGSQRRVGQGEQGCVICQRFQWLCTGMAGSSIAE
jgi:hypothetical protein